LSYICRGDSRIARLKNQTKPYFSSQNEGFADRISLFQIGKRAIRESPLQKSNQILYICVYYTMKQIKFRSSEFAVRSVIEQVY